MRRVNVRPEKTFVGGSQKMMFIPAGEPGTPQSVHEYFCYPWPEWLLLGTAPTNCALADILQLGVNDATALAGVANWLRR